MEIINKQYKWSGYLSNRKTTDYIILHHAASSNCSPNNIHTIHLKNGWAGIGYHFYVRKNGNIYIGRLLNTIGAHAVGYNDKSVGVCFEGNFENEVMNENQLNSARYIVNYLRNIYPNAKVIRHKDVNATACPGKNFPFNKILKYDITEVTDIIDNLSNRNITTNKMLWLQKCQDNTNSYWLAYKICNMTKNCPKRSPALETINDIVWELNYRNIMTDKVLWLNVLKNDSDLYWLAYKCANMTKNT